MGVRVGPERRLSTEELMFLNWVLETTLESSLDSKEIKAVNPKGNLSWIFIGRTDAEAESPILWPPDAQSRLIGKGPDVGKDWGQEKGVTEDEMVGWHHWLNGHEFGQTLEKPGGSQRPGHDLANEQQNSQAACEQKKKKICYLLFLGRAQAWY